MFGVHFNHNQLRRALLAFGSFFTNIELRRTDGSGNEVQRLIVPLEYGPKERWLVRLKQDPDFVRSVGLVVPRMSYEITNISYDPARKMNSLHEMRFPTPAQQRLARLYVGVPYTLGIDLSILVKTQADGLQILEQILPYFTPDITFRLKPLAPQLPLEDQIPLTLVGTSETDNYEGDFEHRRAIIWTLSFTMKLNFYGPKKEQNRIDEVVVDIYNSPLLDLLDPPETLGQENGGNFVMEDGSGNLMDESTADTYTDTGRVARIDAVPNNPNQDPFERPVAANTTITESSGDVKRTRTFTDEQL